MSSTPGLFTNVPANQPTEWKPGHLTKEQLNDYFSKGFIIIREFFDKKTELDPVRRDIEVLVDSLAERLFESGKIKGLYKEHDLFKRLIKLEEDYPGANVILHKLGRLPQSVRALWSNDRLLNMVEQMLGTQDIVGNPVWNLRTKTPRNEATTVPWHQDVAYLEDVTYDVLQPTAWIPLLDATRFNGCMEVISGGHREGKVATHQCCYGNTWYVMADEEEMERALGNHVIQVTNFLPAKRNGQLIADVDVKRDTVLCEVPYGGLLLINNMIPHRSLDNLSDDVRWSLDLRWQRADKPVGFYGLKEGIRMRSSTGPIDIDWESFDAVDRHKQAKDYVEKIVPAINVTDTTIAGPWMNRWEIVHTNRHTMSLTTADSANDKP